MKTTIRHQTHKQNFSSRTTNHTEKTIFFAFIGLCFLMLLSFECRCADNTTSHEQLLQQYIQTKGAGIIAFDASNIKQFWIDNTVISRKDSFDILMKSNNGVFESIPLRIQLINVNETQDCEIEIIADTDDFSFSVLDNNAQKVVATSSRRNDFLQYKVETSILHLENTANLVFFLKFSSKKNDSLKIKGITLSFSDNKNSSFLVSPGVLHITGKDVRGGDFKDLLERDNTSFSVSGKRFSVFSKKRILVSDKPISNSVTVKNIGDKPTDIFLGYSPFTLKGENINNKNNPYHNINKVLNVVSIEENKNQITVDSFPEWEKGCSLIINANEDLSDFPNFSYAGVINDVKKKDEKHTEIVLDRAITSSIKKGTKVRVHSKSGALYLYTNMKRLAPGEEITLSSTIKRDDSFLQFSPEAFCKGTYYVVPLILSFSVDPEADNTVLISSFTVSY